MSLRSFEIYFSEDELETIFSFESKSTDRLISRENSKLEFKQSFSFGNTDAYAKTAAAFANAHGGYIVFGVKDSPRQLIGLESDHFDNFDTAKLTNALNERFSPEIHWEPRTVQVRGHQVGIIYFAEAKQKPVICTRNGSGLQTGAIFYRYRGRSEAIKYPELRRIIEEEKTRERDLWMRQIRRMRDVGVDNVGILDLHSGEVSGAHGHFYISDDLLPKLQFIREGQFVEQEGAPALRLIGDLHASEGPIIHSTVELPTPIREREIITAFLRQESVLSPMEYLKAICFEQSYFFPVYFFIQQTPETVSGTIELLSALEVRGNIRNKLVVRLGLPNENLTTGNLHSPTSAGAERRTVLNHLRQKTVTADIIAIDNMRFFEALTHTDASKFDRDYMFTLLAEHVLPGLSGLTGNPRTAFRKAICHLDLVWFRPALN
jgi:hypothetical protein